MTVCDSRICDRREEVDVRHLDFRFPTATWHQQLLQILCTQILQLSCLLDCLPLDKSNSLLVSVQLLLVIISFSEGKGSSSRQFVSNDDRPIPSLLGWSTLDLFFGAVASLLDCCSRSGSSSPLSSFEFAEQPFDPNLEFAVVPVVLAAAGASASSGTGNGILEGWFWNCFNTSLPNSSCSL